MNNTNYDISHYILSCNFYKINIEKYFKQSSKIFKHYHFSDASGFDGEGVMFGDGDLVKSGILSTVFKDKKKIKVLETWQGHLDNCYKFKKDILRIKKYIIWREF